MPKAFRRDTGLAPIDEKIYFETKKAEWSHDLTSQFSSYEQYRKYGLGIAALCGRELVAALLPIPYMTEGLKSRLTRS